jgi:hypothetical protein
VMVNYFSICKKKCNFNKIDLSAPFGNLNSNHNMCLLHHIDVKKNDKKHVE